jgi:hypothetical protein
MLGKADKSKLDGFMYKKKKSKSTKRKNSKSKQKKIASKRLKSRCKNFLKKKIAINMTEYKKGRFKSPAQAIAVSYSELKKRIPSCKRFRSIIKKKKYKI